MVEICILKFAHVHLNRLISNLTVETLLKNFIRLYNSLLYSETYGPLTLGGKSRRYTLHFNNTIS